MSRGQGRSRATANSGLRLGIVQRILTPYRVPFFEELGSTTGMEVALCSGAPMPGETVRTGGLLSAVSHTEAKNRYLRLPIGTVVWQSGLQAWLRSFDPDVLVLEANPWIFSHWTAMRWMHQRRRPVLGWGLGELERKGPALVVACRQAGARMLARSFDGMLAYSTKAKNDFVNAGVPQELVTIAHNATDHWEAERYLQSLGCREWIPRWRSALELDPMLPIVLSVGRLLPEKQVDVLIRACTKLADRCQLLVVGEGPAREGLEQVAARLGVPARFIGHQTGEDLARCFLGSSLFVLPAAGGLALHQAMSFGLPVIASFGDGTEADLVREGRNGYLFQLGDAADLEAKLTAMLGSSFDREAYGRESRAIVRDEINLDRMAERFLDAVRGAAARLDGASVDG